MNLAAKKFSRVQRKWNYLLDDLRSEFGMNKEKFQKARGARIVVYHGICQTHHTRFNSIFLKLKTFETHLRFYKKYFHVISLNEFYNQQFNEERFNICISFDDGFANNYKYVLPLMQKYQMPATFFITAIRGAGYDVLWNDILALSKKYGPASLQFYNEQFYKNKHGDYVSKLNGKYLKDLLRETDFDKKAEMIKLLESKIPVADRKREEDYWLQMTKEEIKMFSQSQLVTIGCHGYYHNDLSKISIDKARVEITNSKKFIENITGEEIDAIAFPYGTYSRSVVAESKAAGFTKLLATDFLFSEDHADASMRERFTINPYISVNNQMIAIINGKYR
jgi:peptidoglycan/xylan/chitin deacetylase (PgdA/CDA1 family)